MYPKSLMSGPATYSKHASRFPSNFPKYIQTAHDSWLFSTTGERYFDTIAGLGATVLGYGALSNSEALVSEFLNGGGTHSLASIREVEAANLLTQKFGYPSVRFGKNGADATQAAVRLARYVSGAQYVLYSGYHGMHDWYIGATQSNGGVLPFNKKYSVPFEFFNRGDLELKLQQYSGDTAAVIVEIPPMHPDIKEESIKDYLWWLEEITHNYGVAFILDEIVTSSRYGASDSLGLANHYSIAPDILCVGKGIANGYPISAVLCNEKWGQHFKADGVFFSTTFGGETISLVAMMETINRLTQEALSHKEDIGSLFLYGLRGVMKEFELPAEVWGDHARMTIKWSGEHADLLKTAWMFLHAERKILYGVPIFPMTCWKLENLAMLIDSSRVVANALKTALECDSKAELESLIPSQRVVEDVFKRYN